MWRILGILVPALFGIAVVWFLVPAGGGARDDAAAKNSQLSADDKKVMAVAISALIRDPEDLFGKPLQIVTPDNQFTPEDLENADAKFLSRAYQECRLVMDAKLYRRYLESIGEDVDEEAVVLTDEAQLETCIHAIRTIDGLMAGES